jgi:CheY-like chemotaxis protein
MLENLRILVLEDEFLIAMDVEQLCLDNGAAGVRVVSKIEDADHTLEFDAAIVDVYLNGSSTFEFADGLKKAGKPFVFASGYSDNAEVATRFPGVVMVGKPYSGLDLVEAVARACGRVPASSDALL